MATNTSDFFTFSKTAGTAKNLQKPTDGGDNNLWGGYINVDLDTIVGAVNATSDLIADANQNELVDFTATTDAVNHVGITNAAAGNGPTISATGDDTHIDLNITPKGTGDSVFSNKIKVDDVVEKTTDHGVEIDGVTLKDGGATFSATVDLQGNVLILDADNDTFIAANSDDQIDFRAGGTDSVKIGNEHLTINNGYLVIGTAGHGIDFSAQTASSSATAQTSEILDHYEFGTWAPTTIDGSSSHNPTTRTGYYVRIGNHVTVKGLITGIQNVSSANTLTIGNLPFASGANQNIASGAATADQHTFGSGMVAIVNASATTVYFSNVGTGNGPNTALKFANFFTTGATVQFVAQYQTDY